MRLAPSVKIKYESMCNFCEALFLLSIIKDRSLGPLRAPTSIWRPFGPLDFVLRALRALRPCDPRNNDWIVC